MGNTAVEAHVVAYKLSYPTINFAHEDSFRTWISTSDYIPVKTEAYYDTHSGTTLIEFGFNNYEQDVPVPPANFSLPGDLKVIKRVL